MKRLIYTKNTMHWKNTKNNYLQLAIDFCSQQKADTKYHTVQECDHVQYHDEIQGDRE